MNRIEDNILHNHHETTIDYMYAKSRKKNFKNEGNKNIIFLNSTKIEMCKIN